MVSRRAFTLIELLIIVGVVLLVAACMAPMYFHARADSRRSKCADNLRALSGAMLQYSASNDDTLPMAYYPKDGPPSDFAALPATGIDTNTWADIMCLYVPKVEKYLCPSDDIQTWNGDKCPISYALNAYFYIQPGGVRRQEYTGGGLTEVPDVETKLLIVESTSGIGTELARPGSLPKSVWQRHFDGANWIFGDGHAEFHIPPDTWVTGRKTLWQDPDKAAKQGYPQWFPWVTGKATWKP